MPESNMSVLSLHATALEVCRSVYGDGDESTQVESIHRYYEPSAGHYENPFVTATSREMISDVYALSRNLTALDVPKPQAVLYTLCGIKHGGTTDPLFQGVRVWTDIGDVCESESFDGHRKSIIEHTLNILILPGLHSSPSTDFPTQSESQPPTPAASTVSIPQQPRTHPLSLPIPGTSLHVPSPLHLQLHIITRLSFNEQGLITHHRDFYDIKDLAGLIPGVSVMQWVGSRLFARGLAWSARLFGRGEATISDAEKRILEGARDELVLERTVATRPEGETFTEADAYKSSAKYALGM